MASRLTATPGQIAFDIYGPMVHLQLLSTPPRGDAVTFGFRPESVSLGRTCTSLIEYTLRRTGPAALGWECRRWNAQSGATVPQIIAAPTTPA
jgi:hypothetical protein